MAVQRRLVHRRRRRRLPQRRTDVGRVLRLARPRRPDGDPSPETAGYLRTLVQNHQVTWQSPTTNRLLLEAGVGIYRAAWGPFEMPGNPTRGLRAGDRAARRCNGAVAELPAIARPTGRRTWDNPNRWRCSASYVTGAHNMKFGYDGGYLVEDIQNFGNDLNLAYTFNGGRPAR